MKSKKKPQKIVFENSDTALNMEKKLNKVAFIFKTGDDLRQEMLAYQLLRQFQVCFLLLHPYEHCKSYCLLFGFIYTRFCGSSVFATGD